MSLTQLDTGISQNSRVVKQFNLEWGQLREAADGWETVNSLQVGISGYVTKFQQSSQWNALNMNPRTLDYIYKKW